MKPTAPALLLASVALVVACSVEDENAGRLISTDEVHHLLELSPRLTSQTGSVRAGRIQLHLAPDRLARLSPRYRPLESRTAAPLLVADDRDAWIGSVGAVFEVDLPPTPPDTVLLVDLGVWTPAAMETALEVELAVELVDASGRTALAKEVFALPEDSPAWRPHRVPLPVSGPARLVFGSRSKGGRAAPPKVVAAFANPALVSAEVPKAPDVLLISVDTLRADHLGCYGYERDTSPNIDRLAARGALFERAITTSPWTLPAYGSLFTGRYPTEHRAGVKALRDATWRTPDAGRELPDSDGNEVLAADLVTLAEALRDQGYRTAGLYNNPYLHTSHAVEQGFQRYAWYKHTAGAGVDFAIEWLERQGNAPTFLFLHLLDPHIPYAPPPPWDGRFAPRALAEIEGFPFERDDVRRRAAEADEWRELVVDMYDGEIAYTDSETGRLLTYLEERGDLRNTIVVFHSDHGEELWDHGGFEHGHTLHDELVRVPLAIVWPERIPAGVRVPGRVRTVDVLPTLLELLGIPSPTRAGVRPWEARSLVPWIDGPRRDEDLTTLSEALLYGPPEAAWNEQKAWMQGRLKLLGGGSPADDELYDLDADPGETTNVAARDPEAADRLRAALAGARAELLEGAMETRAAELPPHVVRALEAIGYGGE